MMARGKLSLCMFIGLTILSVMLYEVCSSPLLPSISSKVESWTEWGTCSQQCGGGVSERRHICHDNSDSLIEKKCEETVQYKLCNYQKCPGGKEGIGWHQLCSRFNNVYYHWRPYRPRVDGVNSCALRCYATENIKLMVQLPDMHDGKLCSNRDIERGVCQNGECVKVGCDGILNSDKAVDVCGVCGGNSSVCESVEGEFQTSNLKVGYNKVVEIPTGAKNIQIVEKRGKNYLALQNGVGDYFLNGGWLIERPGQINIAGTLVNYRRPQRGILGRLHGEWETITAPGPTNTSICVMVLCADTSAHIAYKFTLPTTNQEAFHVESVIGDETYTRPTERSPSILSKFTTTVQTTEPGELVTDSNNNGSFRDGIKSDDILKDKASYLQYDSPTPIRPTSEIPFLDDVFEDSPEHTTERPADLIIDIESDSTQIDENKKLTSKRNHHHIPSTHAHEDLVDVGLGEINATKHPPENVQIGTSFNIDIKSPDGGETATSSEYERGPEVFRLGYVLYPPEESDSEMSSEWFVRVFPDAVEDVNGAEETVVEDFTAPTAEAYENTSTDVMNVNPNGARNTWTNQQNTYHPNNGGIQSTYTWTTAGASDCSATCTRGVTTISPYCQSEDGQRVGDHYCDINMKPSVGFNECLNEHCEARWEVSKWSGCSKTCDEGRITRLINCWRMIKPGLDTSVDSGQCAHIPKPNSSEPCENMPCTPTWRSSEWKSCNVSCGEGYETRDVSCVGPFNVACDQSTKPVAEKRCDAGRCKYQWHALSDWTLCPGICGVQTRNLECRDYNGTTVTSQFCQEIEQRYEGQLCGAKTCSNRWVPQPWSPCSAKCGQGTRTRTVICASVESNKMVVHPENAGYCSGIMPSRSSRCYNGNCVSRTVGQWFTSKWSECSVTCGNGYRHRDVKCYYKGVEVNGCINGSKPVSQMVCHKSACLLVAAATKSVCRDEPGQSCPYIRAYSIGLCRLKMYSDTCCETCAAL
ncbi:ADAMTS-like protein 2 [Antedon mediterranea]|uniref:ADAMTS-like protein 2 n=1 Tax=Antedon mediterranea TaxID=105859 RepID=UPI003AF74D6C